MLNVRAEFREASFGGPARFAKRLGNFALVTLKAGKEAVARFEHREQALNLVHFAR